MKTEFCNVIAEKPFHSDIQYVSVKKKRQLQFLFAFTSRQISVEQKMLFYIYIFGTPKKHFILGWTNKRQFSKYKEIVIDQVYNSTLQVKLL